MQPMKCTTTSEWKDDEKAAVLLSPFRDKSLNPHSWERKMNFWTDALLECAQTQDEIILDLQTFTKHFERCGKYPKCLETVTKEMIRSGKLKTLSDFQNQSDSWLLWGFDTFFRKPVHWGLGRMLTAAAEKVFVIPEQVKKKSVEVLADHYSRAKYQATGNIMEFSAFRAQCLQVLKSELECDVIIKQLELDRKLLVTKAKDGTMIVKVCGQGETRMRPVQEIELNIFRIQKVMRSLEQQVESLSGQTDDLTAETRTLVKEGKKTLALRQLRKRRNLLRLIEKKSSTLDTLHDIMHKIEDASSNEMVVKAYEGGISAIRQLTGDLTVDKVDTVLDDLQQVFEEQEEINEAIAGVGLPGADISSDALENELDSLLAEGSEKGDNQLKARAFGEKGDNLLISESNNVSEDDLISNLAKYTLEDLPEVPSSVPGHRHQRASPQKHLSPSL